MKDFIRGLRPRELPSIIVPLANEAIRVPWLAFQIPGSAGEQAFFPAPHQTEGQIVLNPSTNIVVGQIEVQVPESHLPGAAFTLDEVPFVERRLVSLGDD